MLLNVTTRCCGMQAQQKLHRSERSWPHSPPAGAACTTRAATVIHSRPTPRLPFVLRRWGADVRCRRYVKAPARALRRKRRRRAKSYRCTCRHDEIRSTQVRVLQFHVDVVSCTSTCSSTQVARAIARAGAAYWYYCKQSQTFSYASLR